MKRNTENTLKKALKTWLLSGAILVSAATVTACGSGTATDNEAEQAEPAGQETETENETNAFFTEIDGEDLVILFTTDVHHKLTEYMGYDGLMAIKRDVEDIIPDDQLIMVDCGDCLDGGELGEQTEGMGIAEIMDYVGIDVEVPGNHDFKYGVAKNVEIANASNFHYLSCNLRETASGKQVLEPYVMLEKGGKKIGIVGITTPQSTFSPEGSRDFAKTDALYDFSQDCMYEQMQTCVDQLREDGADYVIVVAHLGRDTDEFSSVDMIGHTTGIDAVIDGHEHIDIEMEIHQNANGEDVLLTSSGRYMEYVGELVIEPDGNLRSGLLHVSDYQKKDSETTDYIMDLKSKIEE